MQIKRLFLLAAAAVVSAGTALADGLPSLVSSGNISRWYYIRNIGVNRYLTANAPEVEGEMKAGDAEPERRDKQLWKFTTTDDGQWYTITNKAEGLQLGVGLSAAHNNWESTQLMETSNTRFKIRFRSDSTLALQSENPAPGGGEIFVFPAVDGNAADNFMYWLVREANSEGDDSYMQVELYSVEEYKKPLDEMNLEEYLEAMPYGIDDYTYDPTAPGCVGDADAYEAFFNALTTALDASYDASSTEEAKNEALQNLKDAEKQVSAAINPVTDGLYFIESTYAGFANADTMAWYAPLLTYFPGWEKKRNSVLFMWDVKKLADGTYSMRNLATGQYANHCVNPDITNSPLRLSDDIETAQAITNIAPNGQFTINSVGATWAYFPQEYNDGQGTHGPLASNEDIAPGGTATWRLVPVSDEELAEAQAVQNRDILANMLTSFADNYAVGPDPGYLSQEAYDALQAEFAAAKQLVDNSATDAECKEQLDKIQAAKEALEASELPVTDGYYAVLQYPYSQYPQSEGKAWKANTGAGWLYSPQWKDYDPSFIWRISSIGNGRFSIQNYETGEYINSTDIVPLGAIGLTTTQATPQTITSRGAGAFTVSNITLDATGNAYNTASDVVWAYTGGSAVYLHKYSDEEVAQMAANYPQRLRNDTIKQLILEATPYTTLDSVYTADRTAPVVTDAAQLFITNQSVEIYDLHNLIDDSYSTYAISAYATGAIPGTERDDYHAIRIDAGEGKTLPRNLALYWHFRPGGWANVFRPIHVRIYASNDLVNWDFIKELQNPEAGFPENEDATEYVTPKAIVMPGQYRYLNMKVIDTNNHAIGLYGHTFFTFSEFNAYPMTAAKDETSIGTELQTALDGLRTALAEATPKAEAGNASAQDIASFRAAYNEFLLNWKDTTDLYNTYAEASELSGTIITGGGMFSYSDESAEAFDSALEEVEAARPFTEIGQHEVARLDTLLTQAMRNLQSSIIGPDPDKWYTVYSADASATDGAGNTMVGQIAWMGGFSSVDGLGAGGESETAMLTDARRAWKFEPTDTPLVYNMICAGSGWPLNLGPIRITPLGDGQFALLTGTELNSTYYILTSVLPGVPNSPGHTAVKDGTGAWAMEEAPATLTSTIRLNSGSVTALVLPYDTRSLPTGTNGEAVKTYKVCGYELAADGKTVTGINLAEITDGGIKAGTPFVVAAGDGSPYDADTRITIDLHPEVNGTVSRDVTPQNGLYGTFSATGLPQGMICFSRDSAYVEPEGFQVGIQRGYLDISAVTPDPGATVAKTVPVSGSVVLTTGIGSVSAAKATVDVYTTDGILVRKGVKADEAAKGLKRGVYIIGKKKTVVK